MPAAVESQFVIAAKDLAAKISASIEMAESNKLAAENISEWAQTLATMADGLKPRPYLDMLAPPGFIDD
jgi:hypothetical protein